MAAPPNADALYKKDIVHNLGYNPLVMAYVYLESYLVTGWCKIPISYYDREWVEPFGWSILNRSVTYEHIDENTVRFYGAEDMEIKVDLFIEPRKDAWYG